MLVVGADELGDPLGTLARCPACGDMHTIHYADKVMPDARAGPFAAR